MNMIINGEEGLKFLLNNGLLFEINRTVLHPYGIALCINQIDDGSLAYGGLWQTDDPEGIIFDEECMADGEMKMSRFIEKIGAERLAQRKAALGYLIQDSSSQ